MLIAKRLKRMAMVMKMAMTKSGTDSAVMRGMKMTTQGMKPARQPMR